MKNYLKSLQKYSQHSFILRKDNLVVDYFNNFQ